MYNWRSKAKVIYRCTPQWFVPMDKVIDHDTPRCAAEAEIRAHQGDGETLRETAMRAIAETRFVPAKGRNRISSMVEGRQIGRASCRERVCQYVSISVGAGTLKKKK